MMPFVAVVVCLCVGFFFFGGFWCVFFIYFFIFYNSNAIIQIVDVQWRRKVPKSVCGGGGHTDT